MSGGQSLNDKVRDRLKRDYAMRDAGTYTPRNFLAVATCMDLANEQPEPMRSALKFLILSYNASHSTLMTRIVAKRDQRDFVLTGAQSGVLYISGLPVEKNVLIGIARKAGTIAEAFAMTHGSASVVNVHNVSSERLPLADDSIDYVFTDPPFGDYIPYGEINQINELWLGKTTDLAAETVVSVTGGKDADYYQRSMSAVFTEVNRVLKPSGRVTVVFHSAHARIWRALTESFAAARLRIRVTSVGVRMVSSLDRSADRSAQPLPDEIHALLGRLPCDLIEMGDLPISIGQGLRTGANDFFYVKASADLAECVTSPETGKSRLLGMDGLLQSTVRDQRSAARHNDVAWHDAVLDLRSVALPEDIAANGSATRDAYRPMCEPLADHVRRSANVLSGKPGRERPVATLSAVVTNVRPERPGRPARFWYQLPDMQPRHWPDVYMARIHAGRPQAMVNEGRSRLIDANFITFVCDDHTAAAALAAALNSDWVWAYLELTGAVMGGGALKIEGTMLRRLPLPTFMGQATKLSPSVSLAFDRMLNERIGSKAMRAMGDLARARWAARTRQHLRGAA